MLWCSHWKGTPQDCIDHFRLQHHVGLSVKTANLGKWFPPWTVTRVAWSVALKPNVSGIATDVVLFSEHGARLYRVYREYVSHNSLRGTFMTMLSDFTNRAFAEAWSVAKRGQDSSTESGSSPSRPASLPLRPTHLTPNYEPSAHKAARAVASATSPDDADVSSSPMSSLPLEFARRTPARSPVGTSASASIAEYSAPPAPVVCPLPSDRRRPALPVSLPLPHFATEDFALKPDTAPPYLVATQLYLLL